MTDQELGDALDSLILNRIHEFAVEALGMKTGDDIPLPPFTEERAMALKARIVAGIKERSAAS